MTENEDKPNEAHRPSASPLLPDVDAETYAAAQELAAKLSTPTMPCDADDVLLAGYLQTFGQNCMTQPKMRTQAMRKLFESESYIGQRCLIGLAKSIRKMHGAEVPIEVACLDFTTTLAAALVLVAPDKKRFGKFGKAG